MSIHLSRPVLVALCFVVIGASGYWLTHLGRPYSVLILTAHKLISVGAFVLLVIATVQAHKAASLGTAGFVSAVIAGLCFLVLIATGGMLSSNMTVPAIGRRLHHIAPYLTVLSSAVTLYFLGA
jgi:hypothetical protein